MLSGKGLATCCGVFLRSLGIHLEMSHKAGRLCARELPAASEEGAPPLCLTWYISQQPVQPVPGSTHKGQPCGHLYLIAAFCTAVQLSHPWLQCNILWDE